LQNNIAQKKVDLFLAFTSIFDLYTRLRQTEKPLIKGGFSVWLGYWGGEARCKLQATFSFLIFWCNLPPSHREGWVFNPFCN
jgi:hypothetical protein